MIGTIYPDPNTLYDNNHTVIYSINGTTGTNQFLNTYNHSNRYNGLKLGQIIQINDGVYNKRWYIAGFDLEDNRVASDDSLYDNGYGIMLIPETELTSARWHTSVNTNTPYINSTMHTTTLPTIANNLKTVLGNHLVNRNVLLSSSISTSKLVGSTAYTWTTAYCTLPSIGQLTGTFASHNNKYDDGEANYKLPLFNFMEYKTDSYFWSRGVKGNSGGYYFAWRVIRDGTINSYDLDGTVGVRPLIYIR